MPLRLLDRVNALRYVTAAENVENYRAVVECFVLAKDRYEIELRPADVRERLARSGLVHDLAGEADLDRHLDQLVEWGNLQRSHDTAAVGTLQDFYRRNFVYRLTPQGEVAYRAVADVERTVGRQGALQPSMLVEIRDALAALLDAAHADDAAARHRALHRLRAAFGLLTLPTRRSCSSGISTGTSRSTASTRSGSSRTSRRSSRTSAASSPT